MGSGASASHVAHTHAHADADADADAQVQAMAQRTRRRREDRTKAPFTHCSRTASCCTSLLNPRGLRLLLPGARSRSRFQSATNTAPDAAEGDDGGQCAAAARGNYTYNLLSWARRARGIPELQVWSLAC